MTLKDLFSEWESYSLLSLSEKTFKVYRKRLQDLVRALGEDREIKEFSKKEIAYYFKSIKSESVR